MHQDVCKYIYYLCQASGNAIVVSEHIELSAAALGPSVKHFIMFFSPHE